MKYDTQTPYLASFIIVKDHVGRVAFVLRSNTQWMNGHYGLPSGKVEDKESFRACAVREGLEEAGITLKATDIKFVHVMHRYTNSEASHWVDVFFEAPIYAGNVHNAEPEIHGELKWLELDNLPENVVPPVRYALKQIQAGKAYSEYGWD